MSILSKLFGVPEPEVVEYYHGYEDGAAVQEAYASLGYRERNQLQVKINEAHGSCNACDACDGYDHGVYDGMTGNEPEPVVYERPWWRLF